MTNPNPPTARGGVRSSQAAAASEHMGAIADDKPQATAIPPEPTTGAVLNPRSSQVEQVPLVEPTGFEQLDLEAFTTSASEFPGDVALFLTQAIGGYHQLLTGHLARLESEHAHTQGLNPNKAGIVVQMQATVNGIRRAEQVLKLIQPAPADQPEEG